MLPFDIDLAHFGSSNDLVPDVIYLCLFLERRIKISINLNVCESLNIWKSLSQGPRVLSLV